jgi:putative addiction module component (TIGR02574 family)
MMTREQILSEAMALDSRERELLAEQLWLSIDGSTREEVEQAWGDEIQRRAEDADEHPEEFRPAEDVGRALRARLKQ